MAPPAQFLEAYQPYLAQASLQLAPRLDVPTRSAARRDTRLAVHFPPAVTLVEPFPLVEPLPLLLLPCCSSVPAPGDWLLRGGELHAAPVSRAHRTRAGGAPAILGQSQHSPCVGRTHRYQATAANTQPGRPILSRPSFTRTCWFCCAPPPAFALPHL